MQNLQSIKNRLYSRVSIDSNNCWNWQGAVDSRGYGNIGIESFKTERVHRVSWQIYYNAGIPKGASVLHKCDNKICINPEHLYLGTQAQNVKDSIDRGLFKPHPSRKLSNDQVEEVKELYKTRKYSMQKIADMFNVGRMTIRNIISYGMYKI